MGLPTRSPASKLQRGLRVALDLSLYAPQRAAQKKEGTGSPRRQGTAQTDHGLSECWHFCVKSQQISGDSVFRSHRCWSTRTTHPAVLLDPGPPPHTHCGSPLYLPRDPADLL